VIFGANGTGKTSLCEALEWGLTGQSYRLQTNVTDEESDLLGSPLVNLIENTTKAQVELSFDGSEEIFLKRSIGREKNNSILELNGSKAQESDLIGAFSFSSGELGVKISQSINIIKHCHFLSQEIIQEFLSNDPKKRYEAYTSLIGTDNLRNLRKKGDNVNKLLKQDLDDIKQKIKSINCLIVERQKQKTERLATINSVLEKEVYDEKFICLQSEKLKSHADRIGMHFSLDGLPNDTRAQTIAETILGSYSSRITLLKDELSRLQALLQKANEISAIYEKHRSASESLRTCIINQEAKENILVLLEEKMSAGKTIFEEKQKEANRLAFRIKNISRHLDLKDKIEIITMQAKTIDGSLEEIFTEKQKIEVDRKKLEIDYNKYRYKLEKASVNYKELTNRAVKLSELKQQLPSWQEKVIQQQQLSEKVRSFELEYKQLAELIDIQLAEQSDVQSEVQCNLVRLAQNKKLFERQQSLLTEMRQFLDPENTDCPLCGHKWKNAESLLEGINNVLNHIPAKFREAQVKYNQSENREKELKEKICNNKSLLKGLDEQIIQLRQRLNLLQMELKKERGEIVELYPNIKGFPIESHILDLEFIKIEKEKIEVQTDLKVLELKINELNYNIAFATKQQSHLDKKCKNYKTKKTRYLIEMKNSKGNYKPFS
jgi:DNA repair protein SbcC/Rad50